MSTDTDELDFSILAMMPADTPEYMAPAWLGCLSFASRQPEILAWFHDATGMPTTLGGSPDRTDDRRGDRIRQGCHHGVCSIRQHEHMGTD